MFFLRVVGGIKRETKVTPHRFIELFTDDLRRAKKSVKSVMDGHELFVLGLAIKGDPVPGRLEEVAKLMEQSKGDQGNRSVDK